MARHHASTERDASFSPKQVAIGLLASASTFMSLCARKASRASRKLITRSTNSKAGLAARPKQLLTTIGKKAKNFGFHKRKKEEELGDTGVWRKTILMGDKCEPLNFSGVIHYDCNGRQMSELPPRSPRADPLPAYYLQR